MPGPFQAFPKLDAEFVNLNRTITIPWYRFLVTIWTKTGGSNTPATGNIIFDQSSGETELVQILGASPFVFAAPVVGFLTAAGGQVELNRSGIWRTVSLQGGSFWLMAADRARVSWFGQGPPEVVWWPT